MNTCKAALRIIFRHRIYLLIYLVGLSLVMMAVMVGVTAQQNTFDSPDTYTPERARVTVIDRDADAGTIADGLRQYLAQTSDVVEVEDSLKALQDAVATNYTDLIVIIPQGYARQFAQAVVSGQEPESMETVTSFTSGLGAMASMRVNGYASLLRSAYLAQSMEAGADAGSADTVADNSAESDLDDVQASQALERANHQILEESRDVQNSTATEVVTTSEQTEKLTSSSTFAVAITLGGYPMMLALIVVIAVVSSSFNKTQIRRRIAVSPERASRVSGGILAANALIGVLTVVYYLIVSLTLLPVLGGSVNLIGVGPLLMTVATMLCYAAVCVSIGFAAAQFGAGGAAVNGFANVFALVLSFTSGVWFDPSMMSDAMITFGKWLPGWWYTDAVNRALGAGTYLGEASNVSAWASSTLLVLLFAVAAVCLGLAAGVVRRRR